MGANRHNEADRLRELLDGYGWAWQPLDDDSESTLWRAADGTMRLALWDEAEDPHADDDALIDRDESPDGQAAPSGKTEFMGVDIDEGASVEGAGGAFARGASLNGATGGGTRRMSIADDETRLISELEGQNEAAIHEEAAKPTDAPADDDAQGSGQGSESAPDAENLSGKASDEGEVKERGENLNAPAEPDGADADEDDHA